MMTVQSFGGSSKAKIVLEKLTDFPNVPRKKAKFFNFMKNSFRYLGVNDNLLEEVWSVIEKFDKADADELPPNSNSLQEKRKINSSELSIDSKKTKYTHDEIIDEPEKFDWLGLIKKEILKNEDRMISIEKLHRKVIIYFRISMKGF
jgi:cell growth-regulating nucleolar protein